VSEENPVRVIDVFVEELDLGALGFEGVVPEATGRPAYHPGVLLKIMQEKIAALREQMAAFKALEPVVHAAPGQQVSLTTRTRARWRQAGVGAAWSATTFRPLSTPWSHVPARVAVALQAAISLVGTRERVSVDDLVGAREEQCRGRDTEPLQRLRVDRQLELRRLFHWEVAGAGPVQHLDELTRDLAIDVSEARAVGDRASPPRPTPTIGKWRAGERC
jgi:hypothetical protein